MFERYKELAWRTFRTIPRVVLLLPIWCLLSVLLVLAACTETVFDYLHERLPGFDRPGNWGTDE